jgi:hypothetical protein
VKAVLKSGLKMAQLGPACVGLLAAICAKKYRNVEGENTERQLIADMVQSHSGKGKEEFKKYSNKEVGEYREIAHGVILVGRRGQNQHRGREFRATAHS